MSALLAELVRQHSNKDERLLAASSMIVRLEREQLGLKKLLVAAVETLESLSITLRAPPCPMPTVADELDKTVLLIKASALKTMGKLPR